MPELPEVEHLRRSLVPILVGRAIASVRLHRRDVVTGPRRPADLFAGAAVRDALRKGKQLALVADTGRAMCIHLGMTGQLLALPLHARVAPPTHAHVEWRLAAHAGPTDHQAGPPEPTRLVFRDPRRFGGVWTYPSLEALVEARWSALGPDALTITPCELAPRLVATSRPIKAALLDQSVLAGVGNIYADEALFRAGVAPTHAAARIADLDGLCRAIRDTLDAAIAAGGSTLRDYRDATGAPGGFQRRHAVYGRGGEPCLRCGARLSSAAIAQRTTVWCPACQPAARTRGDSGRRRRAGIIHIADTAAHPV